MITNHFKDILENYLECKTTGRFNKNHEMFKLINYITTDALNDIVKEYSLSARGSCGAGTWTRYPWIAAYNEEITTTIQRGVYIVYLFSEDISRVYLTLNQGCTNLKTITDHGDLVLNPGNTMMPCFFEDGQFQLVLEKKKNKDSNYDIFHSGIRITEDFQSIGSSLIGIIDFSSDIGYMGIDIFRDGVKILKISEENVRQRISRGKKKLSETLAKQDEKLY